MPAGWRFLSKLKGRPTAALTALFLRDYFEVKYGKSVVFWHTKNDEYPSLQLTHPLTGYLIKWGTLDLGGLTLPVSELIAHRDEAALDYFPEWNEWKEQIREAVQANEFEDCEPDDAPRFWRDLLRGFLRSEKINSPRLRVLWEGATRECVIFKSLPWRSGEIPLSEIYVSSSP
jgi:hypothetical protein